MLIHYNLMLRIPVNVKIKQISVTTQRQKKHEKLHKNWLKLILDKQEKQPQIEKDKQDCTIKKKNKPEKAKKLKWNL